MRKGNNTPSNISKTFTNMFFLTIFPKVLKLILGKIDRYTTPKLQTTKCSWKLTLSKEGFGFRSGWMSAAQNHEAQLQKEESFDFALPSSLTDIHFHVPLWMYVCPFRFPHYQEKQVSAHWWFRSCFESAPCKPHLLNIHTEAVFLVISFNFMQGEGLDFQHMFVPRKPTCKGTTWPPPHLQPECSPGTVQMRPVGTHSYS